MPTFMDWLKVAETATMAGIMAKEAGLDPEGPDVEIGLGALESIQAAQMLYELYMDMTQIEELADVEGVNDALAS